VSRDGVYPTHPTVLTRAIVIGTAEPDEDRTTRTRTLLASGDAFAGVSQVCGYHLGRPVGPSSIILTPRVKSIAKEEPL
jgi:hypothetical protein